MKNGYCRLSHLRQAVNAEGTTAQDDALLAARDAASRYVEEFTGRRFYSETATAEYDGNGKTRLWLGWHSAEPFRADLIAPTTVKVDDNGDGSFELTLVENTDYWMHPDNPTVTNKPCEALDIVTGRTTSPQVAVWPNVRRNVQVVGKFGYSEITEVSGLTGTVADASTTTLTANATAAILIYPGDVILVESEQMYVSAVVTTALTVERGINGTTAASHTGAAIRIRRYPEDVERAVRADASRWLWRQAQGEYGDDRSMPWQAIRDTLWKYGKGGVGVGLAVG